MISAESIRSVRPRTAAACLVALTFIGIMSGLTRRVFSAEALLKRADESASVFSSTNVPRLRIAIPEEGMKSKFIFNNF